MPHPQKYVPDAPGLDAPVLFRQGSRPEVVKGFLITVSPGSHAKRSQAGDEVIALLTKYYGTGPGFSKKEIEHAAGVELVTMGVESESYTASSLAHGLLTKLAAGSGAYEEGVAKAPDVVRLLPIEAGAFDIASREQLFELVKPLINRYFPEGREGVFGVHYEEHTPAASWPHEEVSKAVADLVPSGYKVDLAHADKMILVVRAGVLCTAAVCTDWEKLRHYSVQALTTEAKSQLV